MISLDVDKEYIVVKIPSELIKEVDRLVGKHGYRTRPEIIKDAVRALIREYRKFESLSVLEKNK